MYQNGHQQYQQIYVDVINRPVIVVITITINISSPSSSSTISGFKKR
jgi:hypothetical protein